MNNFIEKNFRENEKLLFLRDSTMPLNKPMTLTQFLIQTYQSLFNPNGDGFNINDYYNSLMPFCVSFPFLR